MIEFELKRTGILYVISAPSGGGKSTIIKALLQADTTLSYSVSATTRPARSGETDGRDYHFLEAADFQKRLENNEFLEYANVHGNMYGTLKSEVDRKLEAGKDVLMDLDVQGSQRVKRNYPDAVLIFILPPSLATLERRLRERGLDGEAIIQNRLSNARGELRRADEYDYVIVNRNLNETISRIRSIVVAERHRTFRLTLKDALGSILMTSVPGD